jgi:hypothetical protein
MRLEFAIIALIFNHMTSRAHRQAAKPQRPKSPNAAAFPCILHRPLFHFSTIFVIMAICITFGTHGKFNYKLEGASFICVGLFQGLVCVQCLPWRT